MPQLHWEVVGGADKGGILVREGQNLKSAALAERLSTGAVVEELELHAERLHYRLVSGTGPAEGWVSVALSSKQLLVQKAVDEVNDEQLLGNWVFGDEWHEYRITKNKARQLHLETRLPPVTDLFGVLQREGKGFFAELRPRAGAVVGSIRLRIAEDGTCIRNQRMQDWEKWDDDTVGRRSEMHPDVREAREWSPELLNMYGAAEEALQNSGDVWPTVSCKRLLAWSDLHIDMGENLRHFEAVERQEGTALIVSGDVCTSLARLEQALVLCVERFDVVFYVPGNHELWAESTAEDGRRHTSLQKFVDILRLCRRVGVRTSPAFLAEGVAVCPLFSWYKADFSGKWVAHGGFDCGCYWPEVDTKDTHNSQLPEIADFFLRLNRSRVEAAAALKAKDELKTLWTFSHFLPRPDLMQGAPALFGVMGCTGLEDQIREAGATGHLFGHSHQGCERMFDGIRYVQQPLGYPTDGHREERPLMLWTADAVGQSSASILACLTPAAAELAADRIRGALWGALCADAMGMPVHWYYGGIRQITANYGGPIKKYMKPVVYHDPSFMNGSITPAIGKVINHGKAKYWGLVDSGKSQSRGWHHHWSLQAGENTLEGHMIRLYMREVAAASGGALDPVHFLEEYIRFMTTEGSHNDTFACVYHRVFFARLDEGMPPEDCPEGGEDIETIESISTQIPIILAAARRGPDQAENEIYQTIRVTRKCTRTVAKFGRILSVAMRRILAGEGLAQVAEAMCSELYLEAGPLGGLIQGRKDPMASTFLVENFPTLLHYMYRYETSLKDLVLANVNAGGENCHRGHILGALAGAACGIKGIPKEWIEGLTRRDEIEKEIEAFVTAIC
eukprot:gnl/TRDRNA2_/TRDRNA2_29391_c0_seq1.p1 gnl/TRDRNA2_/TRDRNA2_29391_c0~~gnl/TRDRNA2_/TRDRNA2_29391_c0_seq1.p1  ORF type:complete len:848 (+),score=148.19 gnl/TRDRNA2_/TRDRNA2_29391_c0_seq1:79-2622(+)